MVQRRKWRAERQHTNHDKRGKNTNHNAEVKWEAYHQVRIQVHKGNKGDCRKCKEEQEDPRRRNITRTNMILQEANRQLRKRQEKETQTETENEWWEKLRAQANARLEEETRKRQAHSTYIQEDKQRTKHYHRGKAEDCKTCKQAKNKQQQEEKEKVDEMELYDYEWAEWEKMENTDELEWKVETEQYKQDREKRRIDREEEMILESIEKGYVEDKEMKRAVQDWEWEREIEEIDTEGEEEEVKDGECLGCGSEQRKGTQCLSCGTPVEPKNGSEHYMFGWHDGRREECEQDECREWIERDMLTEWKREGEKETKEYKRGRRDRRIKREGEIEKEKEIEEEVWREMYEESLREEDKSETKKGEGQGSNKERKEDGVAREERKDKGKQKRKNREVSVIQEEEDEQPSQVWQVRRVGEENRFQRDYERASTSGQGVEEEREEDKVIREEMQGMENRKQQEEGTENEQDKGKGKRRHRHTPHKHIGQNRMKKEKSKTGNRNKEQHRKESAKRETKKKEDRKGEIMITILGIVVILESIQICKGKNKGKQRTKKAREKRKQKRDIREKEYIETTTEEELEKIWQEEEHKRTKKVSNTRQWRKRGIKKEKRMGKRWKKGKYRQEVIQEMGKARTAKRRWEEKLLQRMKKERERENKKEKERWMGDWQS